MDKLEVKIVTLEPLRMAGFSGFGQGPEEIAWGKMVAWAKAKGLLRDGKPHRVFGFDNPSPAPGSPNYGYEFWITVDEDTQPDGEAQVKIFPGGLYAVTHCIVKNPWEDIPGTWKKLVAWREASPYRQGHHQWLEEHSGSIDATVGDHPFELDLYLPIVA